MLESKYLPMPLGLTIVNKNVLASLNVSTTLLAGVYGCLMGPIGLQSSQRGGAPFPMHSGTPKAPGTSYTRTLVIPQLVTDNTSWIENLSADITLALYSVNDPRAALHPPKNKGHEVMVYLSYIIDHYDDLPDIVIFMHAHRQAWHNSDLLGFDAAKMVSRLNGETVMRKGYMNMRCSWDPGCPEWLHLHTGEEMLGKQEQTLVAKHWQELFPLDDLPPTLSQPCCAQFAVSKGRILSIPLARFIFYRDWLLRTTLTDYVSGRIWEFTWQYVFTGHHTYCPLEDTCYCEGFGVCFGGQAQYEEFKSLRKEKMKLESELKEVHLKSKTMTEEHEAGRNNGTLEGSNEGRYVYLKDRIQVVTREIETKVREAMGGNAMDA